ncbi:hypothetical protein ACODYM_29195 [Burkholderia gladioli]|uniref:hypothetical protein n=1 Tax=Burkholderia gladioli TaxID=28095 RepID=UPI003B5054F7
MATKSKSARQGNATQVARKLNGAVGGNALFSGTKRPLQESSLLMPRDVKIVSGQTAGKRA